MKSSDQSQHQRVLLPRVRFAEPDALAMRLREVRNELALSESFPARAEAEARRAAATVELPRADRTDIPFVTIDPAGSTDLDQALFLQRAGEGFRVFYAIADVPAFVAAGGAVDAEARERGQTMYAPDGRIPLHPPVISEGAASLLEGELRGAYLWTFELDAAGEVVSVALDRARIRSRRRYSYDEVQQLLDSAALPDWLAVLAEVGPLREAVEARRGGASLNRPDEEVEFVDGAYTLVRRRARAIEGWNAQLSLMTGMAAAEIMLAGGIGILRTMPEPDPEALEQFRAQVAALGCPWPERIAYGEYLRSLDQSDPRSLAAIHHAAALFRGSGYTAFDGEVPENSIQSAVAAPYAHATAPLRRLVDRFVLVTCASLAAGTAVPGWVREALPTLPKLMSASSAVASQLGRDSVDAIEAALLVGRVGDVFDAVVIAAGTSGGRIQLTEPVVTAQIEGDVIAGQFVRATLITAEIETGTVLFRLA